MPTINIKRDKLFETLGRKFTDDEFAELCFEFGLELDEVTSEKQIILKEQGIDHPIHDKSEEIIYRIDIPANRYDLLCLEGLARGLMIFQGQMKPPVYLPSKEIEQSITVLPNTKSIRPFIVSAVLRGVEFSEDSLNSFIDLQDKLHHNICRKRTLVAIGTHDLDKIKGPFVYDAKPPNEIKFVPLNQSKEYTALELMDLYANHAQLKHYLPIIKSSPVYPVITDSNGIVLSLPPIINGDHSKITLNTKNIFIEATATDLKKAEIVIDIIVSMFSQYSAIKFSYERVLIKYQDGKKDIQPKMETKKMLIDLNQTNCIAGIQKGQDEIIELLSKMGLVTTIGNKKNSPKMHVSVPPTRHDILHEVDIIEDVAIAYGYNNIKKNFPKTSTIAQEYSLNKLTDHLREEVSRCGFTEALTFSLCSADDISVKLRKNLDEVQAVHVSNPKTIEFQVCRTVLLPCILKTISSNKQMPLPIKIFEVSDVVLADKNQEVGAKNERHLCAVVCNKTSGFEIIHGLLDRIMSALAVEHDLKKLNSGYYLKAHDDPTYFPKRCAQVVVNGNVIGKIGILHPLVIKEFDLSMPCSALEINIEPFL